MRGRRASGFYWALLWAEGASLFGLSQVLRLRIEWKGYDAIGNVSNNVLARVSITI